MRRGFGFLFILFISFFEFLWGLVGLEYFSWEGGGG